MIKRTITYKDFDDKERIEDAYFNLTKTEMIEFALDLPDSVSGAVDKKAEDMDMEKATTKIASMLGTKGVFKFIKDLVLKSYGVRLEEGRRFAKVDENGRPLWIEFSQTLAFEAIMEEFMSDDIAAANFVKGLIPSNAADKITAISNK